MKRGSRSFTIVLEGATYEGSVALLADSQVVAERSIGSAESGVAPSVTDTIVP